MLMNGKMCIICLSFDFSRVIYLHSSVLRFLVFRVLRCIKCFVNKKTTTATWLSCVTTDSSVVKCTSVCDCVGKEAKFV